ncbi:hypothetical protein GHT06_011404 [Daphnia sinensis]|uniref:Helicase c-terminal domain containing protein n=1 Tax=Daphnia sinensis TaxID=1820382 RepID=A0AAD5LJL5_9CRUS|nr:hypothetical protein GHT06_011404 [Daphnia sinensis]
MDLFTTTMDGKKCTEISNTPTSKSLNNSDDVIEHIRSWIQLDTKSKMHEDAVKHIESFVDRQISCLESTVVERQYVKVVLEMWLRKSLRKAIDYLNDETIDISVEMPTLLKELNSINSFEDIGLKLNEAACQLTNLCDPGCQYLQLLLDQVDLFKNTLRFSVLVASYFKQFKASCIDKVFFRCLDDVGKDQTNGMRNRELIVALNALLQVASEDVGIQNVLEKSFTGKDVKDFDDANGKDLINQLVEIFESYSVTSKNESSEWFNELKSGKEWEPKLQVLIKETCKAFLFPKTTIEIKEEYGRKIIFIKGVSVFVSKIIEEMQRLKESNPEVQEIQIVGLSSVHIDRHLENETWHGTNVGIVADMIFVDYEVCQKDQKNTAQAKEETTESLWNYNFEDDFRVCWDVSGINGEPCRPGMSGGNVHIICNEMLHAERWKVISDGGKGGDGQNGSDGTNQPTAKGNARKWSKEYFNQVFPSMSTFETGEQMQDIVPDKAVKTVLRTLNDLLPVENRKSGKDILPDFRSNFFVEGTAKDGSEITVSYYQSETKRHTLLLCQGSSIGQGGFGGNIVFEFITERNSISTESRVPFVGKENLQPRAARMGVYEAMGLDGVMGTPAGDVGFIHRLDTSEASADKNVTGEYIGFENDVSLKIERKQTKPSKQQDSPDNYYAKLQKGVYASIACSGFPAFGQVQPLHSTVVKTAKKKAVVRQSLAQHVVQVEERKQVTQCLQAKLFNSWEEEQSFDNVEFLVSQMEDKETQLHQLTSQCGRGLENVGSTRFVKPALKYVLEENSVLDTSRSLVSRRTVGCRPVDFRQEPPVDIRCLDMIPTMSGVDSAIHSIFGQMNSSGLYVCNDVKMYRHNLATFIHKKENRDKVAPSIKQFVLRVQKSDKLNYPVASDVKIAYSKCRRTNCEANEFNWEKETESENLFKEYAKFVETPSNSLESAEVEMLAIIHSIPVHVYNDQSSYFKYKETLNPENSSRSLVLDLGNGEWRRLQANEMVENFRKTIDDDLFEYQPIQSHYFRKFLDSLEKQSANQQIIASMKMHNPENGDTPDKLFQLLLESFRDEENRENLNVELIDQYSNDLCWLAELIEKHNSRNLSPIFYLNIVKNSLPVDWRCDFLMLEIYDRCTQESSDIDELGDIRDELYKIARGMPSLVPLLCNLIATSDSCAALQPQNLLRLIKLIAEDCEEKDRIINQQLSELQLLPLSDWYYHLRSKMWEKEISPLLTNSITPKQHKKLQNDVICMLLEIETNNDEEFCNELLTNAPDLKTAVALLRRALYPGASYSQDNVEKNVEHLIATMRKDESKLPSSAMSLGYSWLLDDVQDVVEKSKIKSNQEANKLEYKLKEKKIQKLIKEWQTDGLKLNHTSIVDFVFVYDYAVQKKCTKKGDEQTFRLRDTQRVTIVTLLLSEGKNVLTQVSTGEGKSLIVAGVAIAFALCRNKENKKKKIDVITSNDVLARRDSTLTVADCGLRDLYEYFNVSVANNCSQWVDERTQAYNAIVVYGQLANFQRDYLLDNFYDHNIRGDRTMDLAIIDEVDCMLLDRGSNTLYLSHDIPGMEMLESLYVFIWGKIRSSSNGSNHIEIIKSIKSAILHDLYGAITKDDLESIHSPLKDKPSEKNALWDHLVETKVIDLQGRLLMEDTIESINFNPQINPKVKFYLSSVAKRERSIRIPEHLMPFVDLHLDTWLNNAMQALELKRDEDYVVDQDRTDTNPNLNPQVIIIDRDTGMDQTSSQWDGALHQFVQLKEGCKLTSQCLKAIFVSNAKYVQSYEKTLGVSGTLGSGPERDFLLRNYSSIPVEIPTAFQKRFYLRPTRIFSSEEHWLHAIVKEARQIIVPEDRAKARSLVIFCQSINNVNIIYRYLKNAFKGQIKANHIHCYTRDYEKFAFEGKPLGVGHVIIATNLAGRGTDIKISDQLRENGGLHICLTFLSKNERIEEQAIGRTARNGAPGSGIFLLWETSPMVKKWGAGKWLSMKEERQWREKQRISRLQEDFGDTEFEKSLFDKLSDYYSKLKRKLKEEKREHQEIKTICDSVLDKWALWLDQREDHISYMAGYQLELPDCSTTDISWMTPVRSVTMAKHLSLQKSSLSEAGTSPY